MTEIVVETWRAIAIGLAGGVLGMAVMVIRTYTGVYRRGHGALPLHVALIATSYAIYVAASIYSHIERFGESATWRLGVFPAAAAVGIFALVVVLRDVERRRDTPQRRATDPA